RARLNRVELPPFRAGIRAGTRSVMVAHLAVPALDATPAPPLREAARNEVFTEDVKEVADDGTLPATLSPAMVNGLLRKELGFDGLVVTDAMTMGGLVAHFDAPDAALRAIEAGVDQVLMSADTSASIRGVLAAVKSGRLPEKTVDAAVARILKVKRELGLYERRMPPLEDVARVVGRREHEALEYEVASRSLTLLRDGGALPVPAKDRVLGVLVVDDGQITPAALRGIGPGLTAGLTKRAKAGGGSAVVRRVDQRATAEDVARVLEDAKAADTIVVAFFVPPLSGAGKLALPPRARDLVKELQATGKKVVAVSFGNPYLLRDFPELTTYLCAYGIHDVIQRAVAAALYGETAISGRSPVTLPGLVKRGDGIEKKAVTAPVPPAPPVLPSRV
ncbi:MAG: glycoside hydrolase family 3 C-terminal domain-containing protein, partial [Acidobacteria bacterium]|nr:glycoside hydrolase family 3 C-terminal domain-containing protein [Acidobacteriota bacterium]